MLDYLLVEPSSEPKAFGNSLSPLGAFSILQTITFIDSNISDVAAVLESVRSDIKILLDPTRDGVDQITETLQQYQGLSGIEIISHGNIASLQLGSVSLGASSLSQYTDRLHHWKSALVEDGDILFYGCNVAAGVLGRSFIDEISRLTGADVAASIDLTGHSQQGGDWDLEYQTGVVSDISLAASGLADTYNGVLLGSATLSINISSNNVQISNYGVNSFQITNTGDKKIARIDIDVTSALYPDSVFDPFGLAGDTAFKALTIDTDGGTGVVSPNSYFPYIGLGGTAGYKGLNLLFNEAANGGFNPGEIVGFSVDMDPNSVAGSAKGPLDAGTNPFWDVGGVSGAELIGSTFRVTFTDGTTANGQLQAVGNQGGSQGLASQVSPNLPVALTVNGFGAGSVGAYGSSPSVIVNGPAGQTARVVLTKGFIQPVINNFLRSTNPTEQAYGSVLQAQLNTLAAAGFPANNAVEFQTRDILLTGGNQDISALFDFSGVANYNFVGEDQLPLGFVASIIDPQNSNLSIGPVTQPIYLKSVGINVTQSGGSTRVLEGGATDSYSIVLKSQPTADVVIALNSGTQLTANVPSLTFTTANWNVAQVVTVTAVNDAGIEGNHTGTISYSLSSSDGNYNGLSVAPLTVAIIDNDFPPGVPIRIEAESADLGTYRVETNGSASGGQVLSLVGGGTTETGTASWIFNGPSGLYDVVVGYYDENDGAATAQLTIGNASASWQFNGNLGSGAANSQTKTQKTLLSAASLVAGSVVQLTGTENLGEHARIDYIEFVPQVAGGNTPPGTTGIPNVVVAQGTETTTIDLFSVFNDAQDPDSALTYAIYTNTNAGLFTSTSINPTTGVLTLNYAPGATGSGYMTIQALDTGGLAAVANFQVTVNPVTSSNSVLINAGGGAYTDSLGQVWSADRLFTGGTTYSTTAAIGNTTSGSLFQNERTGKTFSYGIAVANGSYEVNLGFAELYWNAANSRIFSVTGEGQSLLSNYDLWSDAGGQNKAVVKKYTVNVTDGVLNLNFSASKDQAKVDFLQVTPINPLPGITSIQSGGSTAVTEGSATDTYSLVLNSQPTSNVTVALNSGNQLATSAATLTFTPANWNVAQVVAVAAMDDLLVEGNHTGAIAYTTISSDSNYNGLAIAPLTVAIADNDFPAGLPIRIEAESATLSGYRLEANSSASGGQVLSLVGGGATETGTASFVFNGPSGLYDVIVGYYDENDGVATAQLTVGGVSASWQFNGNLGSSLAGSQTKTQKTLLSAVSIASGSLVQLIGTENLGEHARIDYIEFIPR
jgi:hypothetical protein